MCRTRKKIFTFSANLYTPAVAESKFVVCSFPTTVVSGRNFILPKKHRSKFSCRKFGSCSLLYVLCCFQALELVMSYKPGRSTIKLFFVENVDQSLVDAA